MDDSTDRDGGGRDESGSDRRLIVVVGPTAAGKSELAVEVALRFGGEVVSADAMQVYRGLDIGTGKVGSELRDAVPHHCLDLADPDERFSAGRFARAARRAVEGIHSRGGRAVVAGGTGFYIRALVSGLSPTPPRDERWRAVLEGLADRRGLDELFRMLSALDPEWADRVGPGDRQRILRGLEMTLRLGTPFSEFLRQNPPEPRYAAIWLGITWPRPRLYERIRVRVEAMLERGWLDEVRGLLDRGLSRESHAMQAIGYRELAAYLAGEVALDEAVEEITRETRRYAKRQLSWFRGQTPASWFVRREESEADRRRVVDEVVRHLEARLQGRPTPGSTGAGDTG